MSTENNGGLINQTKSDGASDMSDVSRASNNAGGFIDVGEVTAAQYARQLQRTELRVVAESDTPMTALDQARNA